MGNQNNSLDKSNTDFEEYSGPSKSSLKRGMQQLRVLADQIAHLKTDARATLELPDSLWLSIEQATKLKSSNARNRQLRHAAKLMEGEEELLERVHQFFEDQRNHSRKALQKQKTIETWRDRLLDLSTNALSDFFNEYPETDRQELGTLVRNARKEKQLEKPPAQQRKLFKYLRDQVI